MSKHKKHHHVPEFILKNFSGDDGIFYFNKNYPERGIERRNPQSIFRLNHLYSFTEKNGKKNPEVEINHFKKLDADAHLIVNKILKSIRANELPNLSTSEKETWNNFFFNQFSRSPDRLLSEELNQASESQFNKIIENLKKFIPIGSPKYKELIDVQNSRERIIDHAQKISLNRPREGTESMATLAERGLYFAKIVQKKSFIIGSNPLVRIQNGGTNHLSDPKTEWWYPVSHDIAVSMGLTNSPKSEKIFLLDESNTKVIRSINETISTQSNEIASKSFSLLKSILSKTQFRSYVKSTPYPSPSPYPRTGNITRNSP